MRSLQIILLLIPLIPTDQDSSSFFMGKQFVTSFLEALPGGSSSPQFHLLLHGYGCCTLVSVTVQGTSFSQNFTLQQGQMVNVTLPSTAMLSGSDISPSGVVLVSANNSICVMTEVWAGGGYDSSYVYPLELLGPQYYVITPSSAMAFSAQFAILSMATDTSVTVTVQGGPVTFQGKSLSSGSSASFTLSPYQGAQIQLLGGDLTGSFIQANNPIAVLSGHQVYQRYPVYSYGYVYEQLLPISRWDKTFLVPPPSVPTRKDDYVYVIASQSTNVKVYNTSALVASQSLGRGQVFSQPISASALYINCDHEVMVISICSGSARSGGISLKPFMAIVMPTTMFQTSQLVHAPPDVTTLLQVITVSYQTPGMIMDGIAFPTNAIWDNTMCNTWRYSWVQVEVSAGSHYIQQLWNHVVWAVSYSFTGNMTVASTVAGNNTNSFNFYGANTICFCQDSPQSTQSPVSRSEAPTVAPTSMSQTSRSCQGDLADIYVVMMSLTWWDALRFCRLHYTDLFSVPDSSTQDLVAGAIGDITGQSAGVWIGLRRHRVWGDLYWTDGEPADYINWGAEEPEDPWSNLCTAMAPNKNFTWATRCCDTKLNFICY